MRTVVDRQRGAGKAVAVVILFLLLVILGGYFWMQARQRAAVQNAEAAARQQDSDLRQQAERMGKDLAADIARTLAATLYSEVSQGGTSALDPILANIVRGRRIATVMVIDPQGKVIATTDLRFAGRTLPEGEVQRLAGLNEVVVAAETPARDQVEVDAPLQLGGERLGTIRAFVDLAPFGPTAGEKAAAQ